jgi:hypothetical protein
MDERPMSPAAENGQHERLREALAALAIPPDATVVLGVFPTDDGRFEVHLSPAAFWRVVGRLGLVVRSTEHHDRPLPYTHRFTRGPLDFVTFSGTAVVSPGTLTPGYAQRLT